MYLKKELYGLVRTDERIFDFIQESALDGLWYWDLENPENEWMNARFWTVLGYNPDEMPHKSTAWQKIINQDDLKVANDNFTKHCENPDHPYDQVVRYTHKNGSTVWIRCRGLAIRDKNGKPIRMIGAHQDLSDLKNTEQKLLIAKEELQENEEKYRAFYDNAPLSYQSLDENGCFIDINPMWSKTLGYERDEVIGKWYGDFLHPDYVEHFRINFPAFKKRGYVSDVQFKLRRKDNTYIYVSFEGCVGYTSEGKFKQTYCVFKDITEQKTLENALIKAKEKAEESESQFRLLFECAADAIFIADAESGIIVNANNMAVNLLNISIDEIIGKHQSELHPPEMNNYSKATFQKHKMNINEEKLAYTVEIYVLRPDGTQIPVEVSGSRVLYKGRDCIMGIFRDISERKQAEKEKQLKEELEKKILLSEESLKFKQNFLANMSHEIRTPLTGILGMAEILSKTKLDAEQTDFLNTILISGENLREIINNVLDFSKIEAGKMKLKNKVFPLKSICDTAESLFKSTCKKPITFKCTIDPQLPAYIKCDENRIKQIINNLISNAVKFTNIGEIYLLAQLQQYMPGTRYLEIKISVSDTGVGIPDYLQEKLFRPFSQIDNRDIREFEGTGLGLSICKNLVKMLGGEIGMHSSPNKGSTFWFTFTAEESTPARDSTAKPGSMFGKNPINLRILLAEDKLVTQKVIKLQLNSLGHEVTIAENGEKALEIFGPAKFDLILMDIQMPVMDGITAAQRLKKTYDNLPPIIGLSANAFEGDREKYLDQGMDEYLTKPFVVADFVMLMDELFGKT